MDRKERLSVQSIALIYAFRMLGLFMIYPTFAYYAQKLPDSTPMLIGLALGIYGLTQACLQIPFGTLSDRIGRKPILFTGLVLFAAGSLVAAFSHSMIGIIIGRAIQGGGAIGSTLTALVADSTKDENRLKAMSIVGMTIGLSFSIALVLGPLFNAWIGIPGIFGLTCGLAIIAMLILAFIVPTPKQIKHHRDSRISPKGLFKMLKHPALLRLDIGVFLLHATLTAAFLALPITLHKAAGLALDKEWIIYLPVMVISFFAMVPMIIIAEAKRRMKSMMILAVILIALSQGLLWPLHDSAFLTAVMLFLYFTGFIFMEASLPSMVSKTAPLANKGAALGIFSTSQFLGIFFGGMIGGIIFHHFNVDGLFVFAMILALAWLVLLVWMPSVRHLSTKIFHLPEHHEGLAALCEKTPGIDDFVIDKNEKTLYLKVDKQAFDEQHFTQQLTQGAQHV